VGQLAGGEQRSEIVRIESADRLRSAFVCANLEAVLAFQLEISGDARQNVRRSA